MHRLAADIGLSHLYLCCHVLSDMCQYKLLLLQNIMQKKTHSEAIVMIKFTVNSIVPLN